MPEKNHFFDIRPLIKPWGGDVPDACLGHFLAATAELLWPDQPHEKVEVAVVGAGLSGLTAAYHLRDRQVTVLEAESHPGGVCLPGSYQGIPYPAGSAYFYYPWNAHWQKWYIGFHVGIFAAIAVVILSPFWGVLPPLLAGLTVWVLALGAILGAAGGVMRIVEHNLRGLSLPDDHFAVWLVTLFIAVTGLALVNEAFVIPMYGVSAITFMYIQFGKIRHFLYFFFSRLFFGKFFGRRAVFPHPKAVK